MRVNYYVLSVYFIYVCVVLYTVANNNAGQSVLKEAELQMVKKKVLEQQFELFSHFMFMSADIYFRPLLWRLKPLSFKMSSCEEVPSRDSNS